LAYSHKHAISGQRGATLVEFTITFIVFLIFILAIIEFSLVIFASERLVEATREGARYAIVNDPVCDIFDKFDNSRVPACAGNEVLDCSLSPPNNITIEIDSCDFSADPLTPGCKIVSVMDRTMMSGNTAEDPSRSILAGDGAVQITYACADTGNPELSVPLVTVEAINIEHPLMFSSIFGIYSDGSSDLGPSITLPRFETTRTGEDLYTYTE
jgi:hypothetical protein